MCAPKSITQQGFTVTEIAVTLLIAGMITAMAVPALSSLNRSTRVKQAASDMVTTLAYARNEAISRNAQVTIVASGTWGAGWQVVAGATLLRQTTLNGQVAVSGPAGNTVSYNPNGRLAALPTLNFTFSVPADSQVAVRCVGATLMGQPVLQVDANRDGDCTNG
jgi:type IV fimbrial biogenesis protein FimT